jgi:hypothetical protein
MRCLWGGAQQTLLVHEDHAQRGALLAEFPFLPQGRQRGSLAPPMPPHEWALIVFINPPRGGGGWGVKKKPRHTITADLDARLCVSFGGGAFVRVLAYVDDFLVLFGLKTQAQALGRAESGG